MLRERVGTMLDDEQADPLSQLELIHDLERLGVSYHFKDKIKSILKVKNDTFTSSKDLYTTALAFKLMRQHGFRVSQGLFFQKKILTT